MQKKKKTKNKPCQKRIFSPYTQHTAYRTKPIEKCCLLCQVHTYRQHSSSVPAATIAKQENKNYFKEISIKSVHSKCNAHKKMHEYNIYANANANLNKKPSAERRKKLAKEIELKNSQQKR